MPLTRTVWTLTPEAFDSLLQSLDPDRDQAGRLYENTRRKLLEFFEARGSHTPDEHADETFDRVSRKIVEGEKIDDLGKYCYGVARFVLKESFRKRSKEPIELDENAQFPSVAIGDDMAEKRDAIERRLDCLDECLDKLGAETREFIVEYYREERGLKIERRKLQAARLSTTLNGLRLRASRLRRELGKCTDGCMAQKATE